jgi:glycosyltransferase involved in cell wall biosynthesis
LNGVSKPNISFVLPMFNEADSIEDTLGRVGKLGSEISSSYEIVVADDASTDGGAGVVRRLAARDSRIKLIRLDKNTKFGGALKVGLMAASKGIVIYTDSDLPAKEEDIKKALELLETADIVTAYSLVVKDLRLKRVIMSRGYNFLVRTLFGLSLKDINSGLKIYRRKIFDGMKLISESPFIDVEIFVEAMKRKAKIVQYGLVFEMRSKGHSSISRLGVVARTFWDMIVYRLSK